jgi:protein-S-isoprenylcysteine O-methyltransferase Ste14
VSAGRTLLRDGYELLLVLVVGWLLTLPVHRAGLEHRNVQRTLPTGAVLVRGEGLVVGDELPAYRFHAGWQVPIGALRVSRVAGQDALLVPARPMSWPIGRHGRIVTEDAGSVVLDIGTELGLEPGRNLGVYAGRQWLGDVRLTEVAPQRSVARIAFHPERPLAGLEVTEFTVMTQVVARDEAPGLLALQWLLGLGPAVAWAVARVRTGSSPLDRFGAALRAWSGAWGPRLALLVELPVAGGLLGKFLPSALALGLSLLTARVHGSVAAVPVVDAWPWVAPWTDSAALVAAGAAAAWILATKRSFLAALSGWFAWSRSPVAHLRGRWRGLAHWLLHLVIVWAFASTLTGFLTANVGAIRELTRVVPTAEGVFEVAKLGLWSLTIVGCVAGYAHTVLAGGLALLRRGVGDPVRALDFTLAGWVTNAACYPLLGFAMARLVGARCGADPVVVGGVSGGMLLGLGLLANLGYTASIWNMGARFGVMTDKGLVSHGFFAVVRHPCYTLEAVMFLLLEAPGYTTWREWVAGLSIVWLYWLRSEREDAFMGESCPEYPAYRLAVPYRFLPGIW